MTNESALFRAVERNDAMAVRRLLVASPDLVQSRDETRPLRPYALHVAAEYGKAPLLGLLLSAGADPDRLDGRRTSALGVACVYGHIGIVTALLDAGADPNLRNDLGFTPLTAATAGAHGRWRRYASSSIEDWSAIVALLVERGAQP